MGSSTSVNMSGQNLSIESLIEEVNRILRQATEMISQPAKSEFGELDNVEQRALSQIETAFTTIQGKLTEFLKMGEKAKSCVEQKSAELLNIRAKMKDTLLHCYGTHFDQIKKLQNERSDILDEANQFRLDAQAMIPNCMMSGDRLACLQKGIAELGERGGVLLKKFETHVQKETETRMKCTQALMECDQNIIEEIRKHGLRIIDELKKCLQPTPTFG